jgi:hypothetical protein
VKHFLHVGVTNRAKPGRIAIHAAIVDGSINAGIVGTTAGKGAHGAIRVHACAKGGRQGCGGRDKALPVYAGAGQVRGAIDAIERRAGIGAGGGVFVPQAADAVAKLMRHHGPTAGAGHDLPSPAATTAEAIVIQDDDHEIIVRDIGGQGIVNQGIGGRGRLHPTMRPGPGIDVFEGGIAHGGADDDVVAGVARRAVFIVNAGADRAVHRSQIHPVNIEGIVVFLEKVIPENPVDNEISHIGVISGLLRGIKTIAENGDDFLARIRSIVDDFGSRGMRARGKNQERAQK